MSGDETNELINLVADGQASEAEEQQLDALVSSSPEIHAEFEAVRGVVNRLAAVPPVEPPPTLPREIMSGIRQQVAGAVAPSAHHAGLAAGLSHNKRRWGMLAGWAVAAAAVMAIAFLPRFQSFLGTSATGSHAGVSGAMAPLPVASWREVARGSSPAGIEAVLRRDRDLVSLHTVAHGQTGVAVSWDPARLVLVEVEIPQESRNGRTASVGLNCTAEGCNPLIFRHRRAGPASLTLIGKDGDAVTLLIPDP